MLSGDHITVFCVAVMPRSTVTLSSHIKASRLTAMILVLFADHGSYIHTSCSTFALAFEAFEPAHFARRTEALGKTLSKFREAEGSHGAETARH